MQTKIKLTELDWNFYKKLTTTEFGVQECIDVTEGKNIFKNIRSFNILNDKNNAVGVIEIFDNEEYENITNTIIDIEYRGNGYALEAKKTLLIELDLPYLMFFIKRNNISSLKSVNKLDNLIKISSPEWEDIYDKHIFIWKPV